MKLGILGGSFNPVHLGHLFLADMVLSTLKLDRVVFIPAYKSPFKLNGEYALMEINANDRLDMLSAAITGDSRFAIDDCEILREGVSYTIDTLKDIITRYMPDGKPVLIIGDDLADDFPKWRDSDKILQLADIVIARRVHSTVLSGQNPDYTYQHTLIDNEVMNISSQMVRQRISDKSINAAGWRSLVSSGTRAIIEDRKLYGFKPDKPGKLDIPEDFKDLNTGNSDYSLSFIQYIESVVRDTLSTERFLHSRNTALHASDLCRRFGLDPKAGYLAGITHDFAKQLDSKQMLKIVKNAGLEISAIEKNKTNLLHGKAATVLLRERFCIHNKDVLEAVACHTYGSDDMGPLAKIIYIADKTENSRNIDPALRKMCLTASSEADLDNILYTVLKKTVNKLQERKLDLSESTIKLLKKMKQAEI